MYSQNLRTSVSPTPSASNATNVAQNIWSQQTPKQGAIVPRAQIKYREQVRKSHAIIPTDGPYPIEKPIDKSIYLNRRRGKSSYNM